MRPAVLVHLGKKKTASQARLITRNVAALKHCRLAVRPCKKDANSFQVIETNGQAYIMLNLLNSGFEHSVTVSIDHHKMIIVANDGGFVEPHETDVSRSDVHEPRQCHAHFIIGCLHHQRCESDGPRQD